MLRRPGVIPVPSTLFSSWYTLTFSYPLHSPPSGYFNSLIQVHPRPHPLRNPIPIPRLLSPSSLLLLTHPPNLLTLPAQTNPILLLPPPLIQHPRLPKPPFLLLPDTTTISTTTTKKIHPATRQGVRAPHKLDIRRRHQRPAPAPAPAQQRREPRVPRHGALQRGVRRRAAQPEVSRHGVREARLARDGGGQSGQGQWGGDGAGGQSVEDFEAREEFGRGSGGVGEEGEGRDEGWGLGNEEGEEVVGAEVVVEEGEGGGRGGGGGGERGVLR